MTTTQSQPKSAIPQVMHDAGFPAIPTRIRDVRDARVPPLVVGPIVEQDKEAICQNLAELGIKLAEVHRTAAEAFLSQGLYEEALPHLDAAATFSPGEIDYQLQLGFVQYVTGDDFGAIKSFNTVIAADENHGEAWYNLGMVLFGQAQFTESEYCFSRTCQIDDKDAQTWNNRGVCLWRLGRPDDARACFQNALKIDPNDADARFNLASI